MKPYTLCFVVGVLAFAACRENATGRPLGPPIQSSGTIFLSVTSDATVDPQAVDMAMKIAGFSLDEGRPVVMFFNVKGVTIPRKEFPADLAFQEDKPIRSQLEGLIARGVDVHVCPICMKALGVTGDDLIAGAKVTTRSALFENIGADTAVFTY